MRRQLAVVVALCALASGALSGAPQKFRSDDPLMREPETQDASKAQPYEIDQGAEILLHLFIQNPGLAPIPRAGNVNTVDEVPDSSWFTNRIYTRPVTTAEIVKGPNTIDGPAPGPWTVIATKTIGAAPGFRVRDAKGEVWFISFDPKRYPVAATAAVAVACRLFWALGYNQVENYITTFRKEDLVMAPDATIEPRPGRERSLLRKDIEEILRGVARNADGSYRVVAARALPGKVLGGFWYSGTRPDDPNDIVPHEHRRELRAMKVFGAWTNFVDMKAVNTLDTLVPDGSRQVVRHYLQDVGSTFGTGALAPREYFEGGEYLYENTPTWKRLVSLGFIREPWQRARYEDRPEVGRFEAETFDPETWVARIPIPAVLRARDDDTFWAALRVASFSDELIRAAVHEGRYTDPAAESLLGDVLIARRDKIARAYLLKTTPIDRLAIEGATFVFDNAAVRAKVGAAPSGYRIEWHRFDNATGATASLGAPVTVPAPRAPLPAGVNAAGPSYLKAIVQAVDRDAAAPPVDVYFRGNAGVWQLVGVDRHWKAAQP